ncbi:uncharacterized protein LOC110198653 isoform X1 [Phascolarctos cinereus]
MGLAAWLRLVGMLWQVAAAVEGRPVLASEAAAPRAARQELSGLHGAFSLPLSVCFFSDALEENPRLRPRRRPPAGIHRAKVALASGGQRSPGLLLGGRRGTSPPSGRWRLVRSGTIGPLPSMDILQVL